MYEYTIRLRVTVDPLGSRSQDDARFLILAKFGLALYAGNATP